MLHDSNLPSLPSTGPGAPLDTALQWLEGQRGNMEGLLETLVRENSHTANADGGNCVGRLLRNTLDVPSLDLSVFPSARYADHLAFRTRAPGRPALLVGHLDTVFAPGSFEDYRNTGGRAFGPGVLDMKGGLVVAAYAILALHTVGELAQVPLTLAVVTDEEVGSPESQAWLRSLASDAAYGLVFEGGRPDDAVVTERKGTGSVLATAHGRAAHAGNAHALGVNAIEALAHFIVEAQRCSDPGRGCTVNVGTILGGTSKNTVPGRASCEIDLRFSTPEDGDSLLERLREVARASENRVAGARIVLGGGLSRAPLVSTRETEILCEQYASCAIASGLGYVRAPLVGGGSDANTLGAAGLPCIDGLGPRGSGFHTLDEQIDLSTLFPKAAAALRLVHLRARRVA